MKKHLYTHQFLTSLPLVFFVIFLHPLYGVRLFETNQILLSIFKIITLGVGLLGIGGIGWYVYAFTQNIRGRKGNKPSMWYLLSLNIVSFIIIWKFLLGVVISP